MQAGGRAGGIELAVGRHGPGAVLPEEDGNLGERREPTDPTAGEGGETKRPGVGSGRGLSGDAGRLIQGDL